jgi:hypothetical protein
MLEHQLHFDGELHGHHQPFHRVLLSHDVQPGRRGDEGELVVDLGQDLRCSLVAQLCPALHESQLIDEELLVGPRQPRKALPHPVVLSGIAPHRCPFPVGT